MDDPVRLRVAASAALVLALAGEAAAGPTAAQFLKTPVSGREAAVGAGFAALPGDIGSAAFNPAGLALLGSAQAHLLYGSQSGGAALGFLAYAYPAQAGVFSLSYLGLRTGGLQGTDSQGQRTASFAAEDRAIAVSLAAGLLRSERQPQGSLSMGASLKFVSSEIASYSASALAVDAGAQFPFYVGGRPLRIGLAGRNLGPGMKFAQEAFPLPASVVAAAAYPVLGSVVVSAGAVRHLAEERWDLSLGSEVALLRGLVLRGNYTSARLAGGPGHAPPDFSAGMGFAFGRFGVDYAFLPAGAAGPTHRAGLTVRLGRSAPETSFWERREPRFAASKRKDPKEANDALMLLP